MSYFKYANSATKFINNQNFMKKRRGAFKKRYPRVNNMADAAGKIFGLQNQVRLIKGMINSERQYKDTTISGTAGTLGNTYQISAIMQGDDVGQRQGNSILHKYLTGRIVITDTGATNPFFVRMIFFIDTAQQGVLPVVTDVLESADIDSLKNIDNTKRFWILWDRLIPINTEGLNNRSIKMYKRTGFHVKYSGPQEGDALQNNVYLLVLSNDTTSGGASNQFSMTIRNAFYDN